MVRSRPVGAWLISFALALVSSTAHAGMTMPRITDVAGARLNVISFFLVAYLLLAWAYLRLWNFLARDFPKLSRLSYRGALGGLVVCGLFIYVVLTMISGARELLTPGAWARNGVFYQLREPEKDPKPWLDAARKASLEKLRTGLWQYAEKNGGKFPPDRSASALPEEAWRSIDPNGLSLVYFPGLKPDAGTDVVAYEPGSFGAKRFALLATGEIVELKAQELVERIKAQIRDIDAASKKESF